MLSQSALLLHVNSKDYAVQYNKLLSIFQMNYPGNAYFKQFGLEISKDFLQINAKVLKPPILDIGGGCTIVPRYFLVYLHQNIFLFIVLPMLLSHGSSCKV